jgi:hypothetical protein
LIRLPQNQEGLKGCRNRNPGGGRIQPQNLDPAGGDQQQLQGGVQIQEQSLPPPKGGRQQFSEGGMIQVSLGGGVQLQQSPSPGGPQQGPIGGTLQAMQGLTISHETAAFHQEIAARSAELAAEFQDRICRKQALGSGTSTVCTVGAPLVGSSSSLPIPSTLPATVAPRSQILPEGRAFKPHCGRLPPRSKAVSLEAIRKASASAAQCLTGKPGKQPANLYARLLERSPAITTYDHKRTLCLPERASSFSILRVLAIDTGGKCISEDEVADFARAHFPNSILVVELGPAPNPNPQIPWSSIPVCLKGDTSPRMIPTNPMRPEKSIVRLLAMLEGPDLVGMRGDLAASVRVALWGPPGGPAGNRMGAHMVAQQVPAYADVPGMEMSGVWAFWKGSEVDPEAETEAMLSSVAELPPHKSISHDSHIPNLAISLILYASEVDAETADELLSDAGYMTQLRQARSTKNNPLSCLVRVSERQIAAAGGPEAARSALEQHIQVVDPEVTVVPKVSQSKLIGFTTTLSHPGIVEQLRKKGKLSTVHDREKELFVFQISAQPPISKCGQMIISGEADGYTKADVDVDSARRALTTLCHTPEYARAGATFDVWSLPEGTVCFRILPRAVGLSVARRATLNVGGVKMDVFMCYIANTVASFDLTYKKMLEDWLVSPLPSLCKICSLFVNQSAPRPFCYRTKSGFLDSRFQASKQSGPFKTLHLLVS